ncbi:hypothetical protein AQUCO_00600358v1 [Aquilegia coerulea]|uniref:BED-type domain-containing protein n=1 Tax=Aquilegia coerulea TaxID=218851 RepID=A0A2G5EPA1_AQUCA|nr:hypothetical protein AQUCO_00600358v1 [Aquilegia coerulea]
MKKKDKFWDYAEELKGRFLCNFCQKDFSGGVARLKSHLSKQTCRDIAICEKVTEDVQAAALLAVGRVDIYEEVCWVKKVFDDAKYVVDYIDRHVNILALQRYFTDNKELRKYNKTRFASYFLMLQLIIGLEDAPDFWLHGNDVIKALEPIVGVLRLVDGDGSNAGYLYEAMVRAQETLKKQKIVNPDKFSRIWELFEIRRNNNILNRVYATAAFLNPSLMYDGIITYDNQDVSKGLLFVGEKMVSFDQRDDFASQLLVYQGKHPKLFNFLSISQLRTAHPKIWWEVNGGFVPLFIKIAIRILSQPCISSACERNWSAFDAAQTKKRTRLLPQILDDLVYIRMNSLMMTRYDEVELQDRGPINLEELGDLPEDVDDGQDELMDEPIGEEPVDVVGDDDSWLSRRISIGTFSANREDLF